MNFVNYPFEKLKESLHILQIQIATQNVMTW